VVIVGGTFAVDPGQRDQFIANHHDMIRTSRAEAGCLEYTYSADPIDPGRVVLFEIWESQDALDAHLRALRAGAPSPGAAEPEVEATSYSIVIYDVAGSRSL
jgi:quinol monooxygenase YgiN